MNLDYLKIAKKSKEVMLWLHPSGPVVGSMFLYYKSDTRSGVEDPAEVLNQRHPFLAVQRDDTEEIFLCNKNSIVRVEYADKGAPEPAMAVELPCRLHMMDGSVINGLIKESLPPENSRLYDYMNITDTRFIKLHVDEHYRCLVNKDFIVRVVPCEANRLTQED